MKDRVYLYELTTVGPVDENGNKAYGRFTWSDMLTFEQLASLYIKRGHTVEHVGADTLN